MEFCRTIEEVQDKGWDSHSVLTISCPRCLNDFYTKDTWWGIKLPVKCPECGYMCQEEDVEKEL